MPALADAISTINNRELDSNEAAIAACFPSTTHELSDENKALLVPFVRWCETQRVRALPCRPTTVAAFLQWNKDRGVQPFETLLAIEALHFFAGMANPVATPVVRSVTEGPPADPPRSWSRMEKEEFALLPRHLQEVTARREQEREKSLRTAQNNLAEQRKRLQADADPKAVNTEGITNMVKRNDKDWNGPQGSADMGDTPIVRENKNSWERTDISRRVDPSSKRNDGSNAPLDKAE